MEENGAHGGLQDFLAKTGVLWFGVFFWQLWSARMTVGLSGVSGTRVLTKKGFLKQCHNRQTTRTYWT